MGTEVPGLQRMIGLDLLKLRFDRFGRVEGRWQIPVVGKRRVEGEALFTHQSFRVEAPVRLAGSSVSFGRQFADAVLARRRDCSLSSRGLSPI